MRKSSIIFITLSIFSVFFVAKSKAADLEWSGIYRIEGVHVSNSELNSGKSQVDYGLHHLSLHPKIVAGDGLTLHAQFEIFNQPRNAPWGSNNQLGAAFGGGLRGNGAASSVVNSDAIADNEKPESVKVSQLYLSFVQEYGNLVVGRVPSQFGLGMSYSAGKGLFDHWYDTRDMVGYKVMLGNIFMMPIFAKRSEGAFNRSDDINDWIIHFQYENPETDLQLGVYYQVRKGSDQGSDAPIPTIGGAGATHGTGINSKFLNLFALKDTEKMRSGVEVSFQSGENGVLLPSGDKSTWGGFGVAAEFEWRPTDKKWKLGAFAGMASGDDPQTNAKFEGFIFDRNYDVAMLLFNHPMGQEDFFRTALVGGGGGTDISSLDVEAISNASYLAPYHVYKVSEKWSIENRLVTGWLHTNPIIGKDVGKALGYEYDLSVNFSPRKGVMWVNRLGMLFPGEAFSAEGTYESKTAYGFETKAAISF